MFTGKRNTAIIFNGNTLPVPNLGKIGLRFWPGECLQGFYLFWPSVQEFRKIGIKLWPVECLKDFSAI